VAQVFLSYARLDGESAERLYRQLRAIRSVHVWYDKVDLEPGVQWTPEITRAIRESRLVIGLCSKRSSRHQGVQRDELKQALEIAHELGNRFVIPTRLEECDPPIKRMSKLQYMDLFPDWDRGVRILRRAVRRKARASRRRPSAYRIRLIELGTRTPELGRVVQGINDVQHYFSFETSAAKPSRRSLRNRGGFPQLYVDRLGERFYQSIAPLKLKLDYVVCITHRTLAFWENGREYWNYLAVTSPINERVNFMSFGDLSGYAAEAGVSYESALAYCIASDVASYFLEGYHSDARGCPMDFTSEHSDLALGLRKAKFCRACGKTLAKNPRLKHAVTSMLHWGRE
jgi:hypothetical protein